MIKRDWNDILYPAAQKTIAVVVGFAAYVFIQLIGAFGLLLLKDALTSPFEGFWSVFTAGVGLSVFSIWLHFELARIGGWKREE